MAADFKDAQTRHFEDAEHLYSRSRWANADHLYGLCAECGLKALMQAFGMSLQADGTPPRSDRQHINVLIPRYESYRSGHTAGIGYVLSCQNAFDNWDVNQRYDNAAPFSPTIVDPHKNAAQTIDQLVKQAVRDGLL